MGLFSRKQSARTSRPSSRTATRAEVQAAELRIKARRRLIGALVLVLAAVVIVPILFDDPLPPEQLETPVVLPSTIPPVPEPDMAMVPTQPSYDYSGPETPADGDVTDTAETGGQDAADEPAQVPEPPQPASVPDEPKPAPEPSSRPQPPVESSGSSRPSSPANERTDDGSVALALLEGRTPPASGAGGGAAASSGSFILQVAAYSTDADAQKRRTSLVDAGVTNAYVEQGMANNRTTYRLRVGPFPSRDAAQAAQARLRALGYDNSLLLTR